MGHKLTADVVAASPFDVSNDLIGYSVKRLEEIVSSCFTPFLADVLAGDASKVVSVILKEFTSLSNSIYYASIPHHSVDGKLAALYAKINSLFL